MDITAHIRELLFGHDCVIIPGFGGFIGNYSPARIDKTNGVFYPPVKKISFNRNLNHNDGLLIKKISGSAGMNYGDSRALIEEFVSDLRKRLGRGEKVVFEHIGSFVNNHEGNIQFEPDEDVNYHLDSYGFEPFHCQPVEGYDVRKRLSGIPSESWSQKHSFRKYLWRAAIIVPLAGAITYVSLKTDFLKARVEATTMNPLASAEFEHNKSALDEIDSGTVTDNSAPEDSASDAIELTDKSKTPEALPADITASYTPKNATNLTDGSTYYIITGSFQSEENAGRQVRQLQAAGFNPEVVSVGNGFYRVCAVECPDLATAIARKDSILGKFPGAWISRKK